MSQLSVKLEHSAALIMWLFGAAAELILVMGIGVRWMFMTVRIVIFGMLITPYFLVNIVWYIVSPTIVRRVAYRSSRQTKLRNLRRVVELVRKERKTDEAADLATATTQCLDEDLERSVRQLLNPMAASPARATNSVNAQSLTGTGATSGLFRDSFFVNEADASLLMTHRAAVQKGAPPPPSAAERQADADWDILPSPPTAEAQGSSQSPDLLNTTNSCLQEILIHEQRVQMHRTSNSAVDALDDVAVSREKLQQSPSTKRAVAFDATLLSGRASLDDLNAVIDEESLNSEKGSDAGDDDEDDDCFIEDAEDKVRLHNRAILDIFLPLSLDQLLRDPLSSAMSAAPSPAASPRKSNPSSSSSSGRSSTSAGPSATASAVVAPRLYPIVIIVSGGAWIIGSHFWSSLLAKYFAQRGCLVFCPDYRNFPQSSMSEMTRDVTDAIEWVLRNASRYRGDLSNVTVIGQSAGAHLSWMALLTQAKEAARREVLVENDGGLFGSLRQTLSSSTFASRGGAAAEEIPTSTSPPCAVSSLYSEYTGTLRFDPRDSIHRFIPLSGIYDLPALVAHFHQRGLYRKVLYRIAGGKHRLVHEFCVNAHFRRGTADAQAASSVLCNRHHARPSTSPPEGPLDDDSVLGQPNVSTTSHRRASKGSKDNHEFCDPLVRTSVAECYAPTISGGLSFTGRDDAFRRRHPLAGASPSPARADSHHPAEQHPQLHTALLNVHWLNHLPSEILFVHGDADMSAPIAEPFRLRRDIAACVDAHRPLLDHLSSSSLRTFAPPSIGIVVIPQGTHTNMIVEELLCGKSCVASWAVGKIAGGSSTNASEGGAGGTTSTAGLTATRFKKRKAAEAAVTASPIEAASASTAAASGNDKYDVLSLSMVHKKMPVMLRLAQLVCPF